jgi:hypothetical protein
MLAAIEFVSTKMTVSFSKESLRSFFSSLLALIHDSASWRGTSTIQRLSVMAQELCLTPITLTEDTLNVVLNTKKVSGTV